MRGLLSVLWDFCRDSFEVDSRLFQTLKLLLFKPGRLSTEFCRNRRARYMSPVRLYLFSSFLFFLIVSVRIPESVLDGMQVGGDGGGAEIEVGGEPIGREASPAELAALRATLGPAQVRQLNDILNRSAGDFSRDVMVLLARLVGPGDEPETAPGTVTNPPDAGSPGEQDPALGDSVSREDRDPPSANPQDADFPGFFVRMALGSVVDFLHDPDVFIRRVIGNMPLAMFFLLPFLALALAFCYIRTKRYFVEHLVFGMHIHAFSFVVFGASLLMPDVPAGDWIGGVLVLVTPPYYFMALRRFYREGWVRTLVKGFFVWCLYSTVLFPGILVALFLTA